MHPLLSRKAPSGRLVKSAKRFRRLVQSVRGRSQQLATGSDTNLRDTTDQLRESVSKRRHNYASHDEVLIEASAVINQAVWRTLGIEFYDVQLWAGMALASGCVAEMQTGEGKTLVAALPAFVRAISGRPVHVATSNAYLAERDCDWLKPAFEMLGLRTSLNPERALSGEKRDAYKADIIYASGYEFGFDYLRDQLALRRTDGRRLGETYRKRIRGTDDSIANIIQRGLHFAIVDEVDNVLIDDASSPLVLSTTPGGPAKDAEVHRAALNLISKLVPQVDFTGDATSGSVQLTDNGLERIHSPEIEFPLDQLVRPWRLYVEQALRARHLFRRDVHYVVADDEVRIVDSSTGRIFEERNWQDGLHQAIEAKEDVTITADTQADARVSRQRFFRLHTGLSGMTGTAIGSEREFREFYRLDVLRIPLRKPCRREVLPTRCFQTIEAKFDAIAADVSKRHSTRQPVLIGTRSIAHSELLAARLEDARVPFELLNGLQDADEADVISRAGEVGTVTLATNLAGRGTDIAPTEDALARGGLHVVAAERHESSRVDRQLIGRSARQGNVGSAQFFLSAEDDLLQRHGPWLTKSISRMPSTHGEVTSNIDRQVLNIQGQAERQGFLHRRQLFRRDKRRDAIVSRTKQGVT